MRTIDTRRLLLIGVCLMSLFLGHTLWMLARLMGAH